MMLMQMRLGKTPVAIRTMLVSRPRKRSRGLRVLVVAPNSALDSWQDELALHGQRSVCRPQGTRDQRLADLRSGKRFTLLNKEAWQAVPEIAGRDLCPVCRGRGRLRSTVGMEVVKQDHGDDDTVYIGRPSKWGNPYVVGKDGDRSDVIALYRAYLLTQPGLMRDLEELANKRLGCHCAPQLCHGDVLMEMVRKHVAPRWCAECRGVGYGEVKRPTRWDHVVLDESFIRNPQSKITEFFLTSFRDVPHRWLLTGLANPESRLDYWCQFAWLDGEAFGHRSYWGFRATHFHQGARGFGWRVNRDSRKFIDDWVGRRAFVQTHASVGLKYRKQYRRRVLDLPRALRKRYDKMEREFCRKRSDGTREETSFASVRWGWLCQLCGGFVDGKLVWKTPYRELVELMTGELRNEQVVVWFSYTDEIDQACRSLRKAKVSCERMYGDTKVADRRPLQKKFDKGTLQALLIQVRLGMTSLQLGAANTAVYFSHPASYDARSQSEFRTLLVGKKEPLLYLDFVVKNTVSEDIRELIGKKRWRSEGSFRRAVRARMNTRHA
jgi:hypothetical protein